MVSTNIKKRVVKFFKEYKLFYSNIFVEDCRMYRPTFTTKKSYYKLSMILLDIFVLPSCALISLTVKLITNTFLHKKKPL